MQTKISSISISSFTVFEHNEMQFSPGLNVFIGKNGTGKTHLLKLLYAIFKGENNPEILPAYVNSEVTKDIAANLRGTFKIQSLSDLVRHKAQKTSGTVSVLLNNDEQVKLNVGNNNDDRTFAKVELSERKSFPDCLYIPPQEMLSIFDGFIASWEKRENSFDETYYDLAKALSLSPLKDTKLLDDLLNPLEIILKAKVIREGGRFYLEYKWGRVEAHLVAEGLRKLSQLIYLIGNGSINENTILLWDEPEVHFNPSLIEALAELIKGLTNRGIQIFITTHDYLLSQRLSLIVEYESSKFPVKFFCFSNQTGDGVRIDEGNTLINIDLNPILNEFAEYYDFERSLFKNASNTHK